jgi:hypothetical protein
LGSDAAAPMRPRSRSVYPRYRPTLLQRRSRQERASAAMSGMTTCWSCCFRIMRTSAAILSWSSGVKWMRTTGSSFVKRPFLRMFRITGPGTGPGAESSRPGWRHTVRLSGPNVSVLCLAGPSSGWGAESGLQGLRSDPAADHPAFSRRLRRSRVSKARTGRRRKTAAGVLSASPLFAHAPTLGAGVRSPPGMREAAGDAGCGRTPPSPTSRVGA